MLNEVHFIFVLLVHNNHFRNNISQAMIYPEQTYLQTELERLKCTKHLVWPGREIVKQVIYKNKQINSQKTVFILSKM